MANLNTLSAVEAARLIAIGEITSEELVKACIDRIMIRENTVQAWEYFDCNKTLQQARNLDSQSPKGPLHGIPVGVKDIIDTVDMPTRYGSAIYKDHQPSWDASCVAAIRASGGLLLGKTVTTEFAVYNPGKTTNPHNVRHTPGGSSSGSAAAVADAMVPLALGTQTGGSIIRPAAYCGVVGYKPSYGLINRTGVKPCADSLDTVGIFGRDVKDAAALASILARRPSLTINESVVDPPRIGICRTHEWPKAGPEVAVARKEAERRLEARTEVKEVALPEQFSELGKAHEAVMHFEGAQSLSHEYNMHRDLLSNKLKELILSGYAVSPETYDSSLAIGEKCRNLLKDLFSEAGVDVFLAPSTTGEAPEGLAYTGDPIFNRNWTFLRVPCINIPALKGPRDLPVGLQVIGQLGRDREALAFSDWIYQCLRRE